MTAQPALFDVDGQIGPAVRAADPATSTKAAADNWPRAGSQRDRVLRILARHPQGLTDCEIHQLTGLLRGSAAKRRGELVEVGLVEPALQPLTPTTSALLTRQTDTGSLAQVWTLTDLAIDRLDHAHG